MLVCWSSPPPLITRPPPPFCSPIRGVVSHTTFIQKPLSFAIATQLPPHKTPACTATLPKHRQTYAFPQSFSELGTASATKEARGGGATDCSTTETVDLQHDGGHATATATTAAAAPPPSLATVPPQPGAPPSTGAADVRPFVSRSRGYEPRRFRHGHARRRGHVPVRFVQVLFFSYLSIYACFRSTLTLA